MFSRIRFVANRRTLRLRDEGSNKPFVFGVGIFIYTEKNGKLFYAICIKIAVPL